MVFAAGGSPGHGPQNRHQLAAGCTNGNRKTGQECGHRAGTEPGAQDWSKVKWSWIRTRRTRLDRGQSVPNQNQRVSMELMSREQDVGKI